MRATDLGVQCVQFQFTFVTEVLCTLGTDVAKFKSALFQFTFVTEVLCTQARVYRNTSRDHVSIHLRD